MSARIRNSPHCWSNWEIELEKEREQLKKIKEQKILAIPHSVLQSKTSLEQSFK